MKVTHLFMALLAVIVLASCSSKPSDSLKTNIDAGNVSTFDPANGVVPFPDDLLFQGSTDGTLNIPVADPSDLSDPQVALNALDGFSTDAPITTGFAGAIDPTSVTASSVRMFEVATEYPSAPGGAITSLKAELTFGVDFYATVSSIDSTQLVILPLKPLKPKTSYEVVITSGLKDAKGNAMLASTTYVLAKGTSPYYTLPSGPRAANLPAGLASFTDAQLASLEGLRQLISTSEATTTAYASPALTTSDIILSWSFTTQSIGDVLTATRTEDLSFTPATGLPAGFSPTKAADSPLGAAAIHVGFLQIPYYLTAPSSTTDTASLYKHWEGAGGGNLTFYNQTPVATSTQTIPMLVSIPKGCGSMPVNGWPVVIFQHGITRNRTDLLAVADSLAAPPACMAAVAIDLPLHGLTGNETDGTQAFYKAGGYGERTFDMDVLTQDPATGNVTANASDGVIDSSGSNFINLSNLLETRDNMRQAVSDLFVLTNNIYHGAVTDGPDTFDPTKIYFLGHSLGAIVGTPFLALEPHVQAAVLANGGAEVAKILDGSATFGPVISGGLAANGVNKGTSDYEAFLGAAQTVVDSADPVNYSLNAGLPYAPSAAAGRGLLFFEVVGDPVLGNLPDQVVPNTVVSNVATSTIGAPLAGTEPQLALLGLTQVNSNQSGSNLLLTTKYTAGDHGSVLDPTSSLDVTKEMQTELTSFLASNGIALMTSGYASTVLQAP
jgi:pimeloyl-ACP methyl ester carboxylesterase